jgi:hypothetical protein
MGKPTTREYYAQYYAEYLHPPCPECSPLYRAGHEKLMRCIKDENWGEAYALGEQLYEMCGRGLLQ